MLAYTALRIDCWCRCREVKSLLIDIAGGQSFIHLRSLRGRILVSALSKMSPQSSFLCKVFPPAERTEMEETFRIVQISPSKFRWVAITINA